MPEPVWTLTAVVIGGILSTFGGVLLEEWKARQELRRTSRDRLRHNIDDLMEAIHTAMETRRVLMTEAYLHTHTKANVYEFDSAIAKVALQTIRCTNQELDKAVAAWISEIQNQTYEVTKTRVLPGKEDENRARVLFSNMTAVISILLHRCGSTTDEVKGAEIPSVLKAQVQESGKRAQGR